jgi:hypothetical protein
MKSVRSRIPNNRPPASEIEKFAMKKEWAEFLFHKRMIIWLVGLFSISVITGLLMMFLTPGSATVPTLVIIAYIARVLIRCLNVTNDRF